jgi:hypothetical protein
MCDGGGLADLCSKPRCAVNCYQKEEAERPTSRLLRLTINGLLDRTSAERSRASRLVPSRIDLPADKRGRRQYSTADPVFPFVGDRAPTDCRSRISLCGRPSANGPESHSRREVFGLGCSNEAVAGVLSFLGPLRNVWRGPAASVDLARTETCLATALAMAFQPPPEAEGTSNES